VVLKIQKTSAL